MEEITVIYSRPIFKKTTLKLGHRFKKKNSPYFTDLHLTKAGTLEG